MHAIGRWNHQDLPSSQRIELLTPAVRPLHDNARLHSAIATWQIYSAPVWNLETPA